MVKYSKIDFITSDAKVRLKDGTTLNDIGHDIKMDHEGIFLEHRGFRFYLEPGTLVGYLWA